MTWLAVALAATALVLAAGAIALALRRRPDAEQARERIEQLEARIGTLQEQSRLELLTMGQRLIEMEKQFLRVADRLEALEAQRAPAERYGQLDARLTARKSTGESVPESQAEAALRSMLQQRPSGHPDR